MIRPPPNSGHGRPANPGSLNPIPDDQSTEFSFLKTTFFTPDRKRPSRATALGGFIFFYSPDNTLPAMAYFPVRTGTAGSCSTRTVGPDRGTRGRPCRSRSDEGYGRSPRRIQQCWNRRRIRAKLRVEAAPTKAYRHYPSAGKG